MFWSSEEVLLLPPAPRSCPRFGALRLAAASLLRRCRLAVASDLPRCRLAAASLLPRCCLAFASLFSVCSLCVLCGVFVCSLTLPLPPSPKPPITIAWPYRYCTPTQVAEQFFLVLLLIGRAQGLGSLSPFRKMWWGIRRGLWEIYVLRYEQVNKRRNERHYLSCCLRLGCPHCCSSVNLMSSSGYPKQRARANLAPSGH